jgi:transposase-like protein
LVFWRGLIERRRRSRLSVSEVCERAGVSPASFYQWQRKLRDDAGPSRQATADREASRLVPVRIVADSASGRESAGALELELAGAVRLRIPTGCDRAALELVLGMLLERSGREDDRC